MPTREIRVVIFGAGLGGRQVWTRLASLPSVAIVAFLDNDPAKQGSTLFDVPVCGVADLPALAFDAILVASVHRDEIRAQLVASGVPSERVLSSGNADEVVRELRSRGMGGAVIEIPPAPALRLAIFGTGIGGIRAWEAVAVKDRVEVVAFLDNDERRRQTPLFGLPVLDPASFDPRSVDGVLVGSMNTESIAAQLERAGMPRSRIVSVGSLGAPDMS
jgi:FlaA1/EpsC-like NDP-sugar epimerase